MISLKNTLKLLVALFLLMVSASQAGTSMTYIHTDHLGSPIAATDEAGEITAKTIKEANSISWKIGVTADLNTEVALMGKDILEEDN